MLQPEITVRYYRYCTIFCKSNTVFLETFTGSICLINIILVELDTHDVPIRNLYVPILQLDKSLKCNIFLTEFYTTYRHIALLHDN